MNMDQLLQTFIAESRELLDGMEAGLLAADEETGRNPEAINAIFRTAHTIKGSAGLFGLDHIVGFTHVAESVLDRVRDGRQCLDAELIAVLLSCCDHVRSLIDSVAAGNTEVDDDAAKRSAALIARLSVYLPSATAPAPSPAVIEPAAPAAPADAVGSAHWHVSLRPGRDIMRRGTDLISILRYLSSLGTIRSLYTVQDALPTLDELDPEACYVGFELALDSPEPRSTIEGAFEFIADESLVHILPPRASVDEYLRLIEELPEDDVRLGEILVRCGSLSEHELQLALARQHLSDPHQPLGELLVNDGAVAAEVVDAALGKQQQARETRVAENRSIRIDADRLDKLIDRIGELIIAAAGANLLARRNRDSALEESTATLSGLVEEVRETALQLRMVRIGGTFTRFKRVVHDVSRELGKDIELVLAGEDTELDKTVVEQITDPLTHLVRNAIDHGIEPAQVRIAAGKPARGTIRLNAYHDSGSIVIEVSDDGGGLRRDKILARAVERGLVEPGRTLSDSEIGQLIFEPGFSTAEQITNLSGRGVGMDVVKRNITALRGNIDVRSEEGRGTTIVVRLPLTLAIINGFLVTLGKAVYVLPLDMIEECIEYSAEAGHDFTNLRGGVLPFIRLRERFGIEAAPARYQNIVVVKYAGQRVGLVVDELLGEFQTVIKPLGPVFRGLKCISGSSILGTGEVALILDVPALVRMGHDEASGMSSRTPGISPLNALPVNQGASSC